MGVLGEFSSEFKITDLPEDKRFEHLAAWITARRHYSDTSFDPAELVTGNGGDTGLDSIAIIANNNLMGLQEVVWVN